MKFLSMILKAADSKGRLALGSQYAGKTFLIREESGRIIIEPAVVFGEREARLYRNKAAWSSLERGLRQAHDRDFGDSPPDLSADASLADSIPD